jgi:hypothetical protein
MSIGTFTLFFILYAFLSIAIHLSIAFTAYAFIIYLFSLLPFYGISSIILLSITFSSMGKRRKIVRYRAFLLLPVFLSQIITILTSPSDCRGWFQGNRCRSFIQAYLNNIQNNSGNPDLSFGENIESMFFVSLLLYLIFIFVFLVTCHIKDRPVNA